MQRTFIALKIRPEKPMLECLADLNRKMANEKIRWVHPDHLHITLRFLGDTSQENIIRVSDLLDQLVPRFEAPELTFEGIGVFRNLEDPRVIWIGLHSQPGLAELHARLEKGLGRLGWLQDKKEFCPHLTLGRIKWLKDHRSLAGLMEQYAEREFQRSVVRVCTYFESVLKPGGPVYLPLHEVRFK